jgi:TRAP-type uncharacterized transport system substrate-binding protein
MRISLLSCTCVLAGLLLPASACAAENAAAKSAGEKLKAAEVNNWTIGVAGGSFEDPFIRFAVELAKGLDDGQNLRILPIVNYGGGENVNDLLYLKGVDIAIAYTDSLELAKRSGDIKDIEQRVNYISELMVGELYVYARPEITTLKDLEGKKVSLGSKGGSATTTGPIVFERSGVHPEFVYVNNTIAIEEMKTGGIAAIVSTGSKPNDLFVKLKPTPGFHFVPIDYSDKLADYYLPCPLTHDDYPELIAEGPPVGTLCMPAVLAVYNFADGSDRARRVARFIDYYFEHFDKLKQPSFHPKWKDINLAATVPGWNRYWLATEKLVAMKRTARAALDAINKKALFGKFEQWHQEQANKGQ